MAKPQMREQIFAILYLITNLYPEYVFLKLPKLSKKQKKQVFKKMDKSPKRNFIRGDIRLVNNLMKGCSTSLAAQETQI